MSNLLVSLQSVKQILFAVCTTDVSKGRRHSFILEDMETIISLLHNILLYRWKLEQWSLFGCNIKIMKVLKEIILGFRLYFRRWSLDMFFLKIKIFSSFGLTQVTLSRLGAVKSDGMKIKPGEEQWSTLESLEEHHRVCKKEKQLGWDLCVFRKLSKAFRTFNNYQNLTGGICLLLTSYWVCVTCEVVECWALGRGGMRHWSITSNTGSLQSIYGECHRTSKMPWGLQGGWGYF